jgi:hypothetical protein
VGPLRAMIVEPSLRGNVVNVAQSAQRVYKSMTYDTQCASQPTKKCEFLLEKDGREDGRDDDG